MPKNQHLPEGPEELKKIDKIRSRLIQGDADPDQVAEVDEWERKAKAALILLNVQKHEGVQIIIRHALEEVKAIDEEVQTGRPENLSTEAALSFAHRTIILQDQKAMWRWFIDLFQLAKSDMDAIRAEIDNELDDTLEEDEEET